MLVQADVALEAMSEQLDKEEAGLTTDRGLEGCAPGLQAFELFISTTFRKKYDKASQPRIKYDYRDVWRKAEQFELTIDIADRMFWRLLTCLFFSRTPYGSGVP